MCMEYIAPANLHKYEYYAGLALPDLDYLLQDIRVGGSQSVFLTLILPGGISLTLTSLGGIPLTVTY